MPTATKKRSSTASKTKSTAKTAAKSTARGGSKKAPKGAAKASITNYTTALRWLYDHVDHERLRMVKYDKSTFSLARMKQLLSLMGDPHEQIKTVHIAGSKGKGSTCAMVCSMLESCGLTVGSFSSPHLIDLRERITIDRAMISYNDAAEIFKQIAAVEGKLKDGPATFFEIMTAAAMRYFADQAVDIAVIETGLGGRLDSTNVITPLVTAITHISLDHTHLLGDNLDAIAREKAGIFKPGVPALTVDQEPEVAAAFAEVAQQVGTTVETTGKEIDFSYRFEANRELGPHTRVCITTDTSRFEHLPVPLRGEHQALCGNPLDRHELCEKDTSSISEISGFRIFGFECGCDRFGRD